NSRCAVRHTVARRFLLGWPLVRLARPSPSARLRPVVPRRSCRTVEMESSQSFPVYGAGGVARGIPGLSPPAGSHPAKLELNSVAADVRRLKLPPGIAREFRAS